MPRTEHGETYVTAQEAAADLGISRTAFLKNILPHLQPYQFGGLKRVYYKKADLDQFKGVRPIEKKE